jgi:hypothetical protein
LLADCRKPVRRSSSAGARDDAVKQRAAIDNGLGAKAPIGPSLAAAKSLCKSPLARGLDHGAECRKRRRVGRDN